METNRLPLPIDLVRLIESGFWPTTHAQEVAQNSHSCSPPEIVSKVFPGERRLYLARPPFRTVAESIALGEKFWLQGIAAIDQIDPAKTLIIGDFQLGSDSAIALDYRNEPEPAVLQLAWAKSDPSKNNRWITAAPSFREMGRRLQWPGFR